APVVHRQHARVGAEPLGGRRRLLEARPGPAAAERRVDGHRDRSPQRVAVGAEDAAGDALADQREVAAARYLWRGPSHDDRRIYSHSRGAFAPGERLRRWRPGWPAAPRTGGPGPWARRARPSPRPRPSRRAARGPGGTP